MNWLNFLFLCKRSQSESKIPKIIGGLFNTLRELSKMIFKGFFLKLCACVCVGGGFGEHASHILFSKNSKLLSVQRGMKHKQCLAKTIEIALSLSLLVSL